MDRLTAFETILTRQTRAWLAAAERGFQGCTVVLFRAVRDTHAEVYSQEGGAVETEPAGEFRAIVSGDDFFPTDSKSAGTFEEGWMYTTSDLPRPFDQIDIRRVDGRSRRYKIEHQDTVGTTQAVFPRWRLSALGD